MGKINAATLRGILAAEGIIQAKSAAEAFFMSAYNADHEKALKDLMAQMKRLGYKYSRSSASAEVTWSWQKDGYTVSLVGWAPQKGWSNAYFFHAVYAGPTFREKVVWENRVRVDDTVGQASQLPDSLRGAYVASIREAVNKVALSAV